MSEEPRRRLVLWGVGTSRTLRAHWALHELGLDYQSKPILARSGETKPQESPRLNSRQKVPLLQDGDFKIAESPAIAAYLSNTYGTPETALIPSDPREQATYRMVFLCRNRARRDQPLRDAPPRRSETHLWRSAGRVGKRCQLFRDAAASCREGLAGGAALSGRRTLHDCRHAAHHLPDLGGELPGAGNRGVVRLYGENHLSASLSRQPRGQPAEDRVSRLSLLPSRLRLGEPSEEDRYPAADVAGSWLL